MMSNRTIYIIISLVLIVLFSALLFSLNSIFKEHSVKMKMIPQQKSSPIISMERARELVENELLMGLEYQDVLKIYGEPYMIDVDIVYYKIEENRSVLFGPEILFLVIYFDNGIVCGSTIADG